jgi:hypothetical protein
VREAGLAMAPRRIQDLQSFVLPCCTILLDIKTVDIDEYSRHQERTKDRSTAQICPDLALERLEEERTSPSKTVVHGSWQIVCRRSLG